MTIPLLGPDYINKNGIVQPAEPPTPVEPKASFPGIQIQDLEKREAVARALGKLWHIMGLHENNRFCLDENTHKHEHRDLWRYVSKTLLGDPGNYNHHGGGEELC